MAKNKKHDNDKFYTKQEVSKKLLETLNLDEYDYIIEPSAGNGSFYNIIDHQNKIGIDIEPESDVIIKQNWFDFKIKGNYKNILVVGNPPFGNQGSLAFNFIKKCDELGINTIAFILPKSFKKDSFKRKIPIFYHLENEIDLEDNSFTLLGKTYIVPCVFQIWERKLEKRVIKKSKTTTNLFSFVKKNESPDYAFRRVGFYAGKIYDDIEDKSEQSHYFIKSDNQIKEMIKNLEWEHNNTAGPRSIGKGELIEKLEKSYEFI
jgi:hypothetical protein